MIEKDFLELSEKILIEISDYIEDSDKNSIFDVDYSDGILNIVVFDKNQTYVINKHNATQKIWFSSPISGANYFAYNEESSNWVDCDNKELFATLINELNTNFKF